EPPLAAASTLHMSGVGDTLSERSGDGSHAGIGGDRAGSRPDVIVRLPCQGEIVDPLHKFLPFFRDHFGVTVTHDPSESAFCISRKAPESLSSRVAADCLEQGLRLCGDDDMKPADFLLLRARFPSARDPDGSQYLLPLEAASGLPKKPRDLGDHHGVTIDYMPSRSVELGSGDGVSGGDDGLPEYLCCPRVDTDDIHTAVLQIWGLRHCVFSAYARVVALMTNRIEYVVKLGPVGAKAPGERSASYIPHGGPEGQVRTWGSIHAGDGNLRKILEYISETLPDHVQWVDMKCTGAMRALSMPGAVVKIARASGIDNSHVRVTPLLQHQRMLVQVLKVGGDRAAIQRMRTFVEEYVEKWRGQRVIVPVTSDLILKAVAHVSSSGVTGLVSKGDSRGIFAAKLSEDVGERLWLDGFHLTARVDPVRRDNVQAKLETELAQPYFDPVCVATL
ncbi:unnamed protein product, partial [Ectocarpus fasciculatus]